MCIKTNQQDEIEYAQYKAQCIKDLIPRGNSPDNSILDFGSGSGLMTYYLQELFFEATIYGIDQNPRLITNAKKNYPQITFKIIRKRNIPFVNNFFEYIVAADIFHHIEPTEHIFWLDQLIKLLKPNGYLLFLEQNPWNWYLFKRFKKNSEEKNSHMLSPYYSKKLLKRLGRLEIKYYNFFWENITILRPIESYLRQIPFGSFYIIKVQRD